MDHWDSFASTNAVWCGFFEIVAANDYARGGNRKMPCYSDPNFTMRRLSYGILLLLSIAPAARPQAPALTKPITIGTADTMWSPTLKETRRFLVYTPPSYTDTTYAPKRYPVIYLLDGEAHFHSVSGLIQILGTGVNATFVLPEMIVVAITNTNRTRDMTPTHTDKDPTGKPQPGLRASGGMANFLKFIQSELAPRIERTYRTAPYRVFIGHSLGGITTIDALYTMPDAFNAYVAIDPSLWWDDRLLLKQARDRLSKPGLAGRTMRSGSSSTRTTCRWRRRSKTPVISSTISPGRRRRWATGSIHRRTWWTSSVTSHSAATRPRRCSCSR